jgi:hypothetical protein
MTISLTHRINAALDALKAGGATRFCPADVGKALGTDARQVIANTRGMRTDIYRIRKGRDYAKSLWGFKEE